MKKLIEALHVIQEECRKHEGKCYECCLGSDDGCTCRVSDTSPDSWKINDAPQKALL